MSQTLKKICFAVKHDSGEIHCPMTALIDVDPIGITISIGMMVSCVSGTFFWEMVDFHQTCFAAAIIHNGKVLSDWEQSFIVCLYKGKGCTLERGNYRGLKSTEQVMTVLERMVDSLIRQLVSIDDPQFGFVPGRGTTREVSSCQQDSTWLS